MSNNQVWTTIKVHEQISRMETGLDADLGCFHEGDKFLRKADINFQYTKEEQREIIKCAEDVLYFANKYCFAMTDDGIRKIDLRDYQKNMLKDFQDNRFIVMLASRQIGKCLLYSTKIDIYDTRRKFYFKMSIGKLYFTSLKLQRNLTHIEKIKYMLWTLYDKLD